MQDWQERIEEQQKHLEERLKKVEEQQAKPTNITIEHRYPDVELLKEIDRKVETMQGEMSALATRIIEAVKRALE